MCILIFSGAASNGINTVSNGMPTLEDVVSYMQ
jgi:X-X-X-Leu-X-X-Gly heptad repeat protein